MATREVQRVRIIAVVFSSLALVTLVAFVFAFIQNAEAKKQSKITSQLLKELEICRASNVVNQQHGKN